MKLILQKNAKFSSAGGSAPRPPCLRRLGALPPNPQPPALGASPPDPHWHPAAGGSAPRTPKQPPQCEFLATRLREFTKLPTGLSFFVVVASAVATMRPGAPSPTNDCLCPPPFWFIQNAFLDHRVTTRQQAIMEKGIIIFKHDFRLKFSRLFAKLLATNCFT